MATYKEIKGDVVERVASDPANPGEGDIWYNTTTGVLKGYQYSETWSNGGNLNTARGDAGGAGLTQTAALVFGGGTPLPNSASESYNGTGWTSTPSLNTARKQLAGAGSQQLH